MILLTIVTGSLVRSVCNEKHRIEVTTAQLLKLARHVGNHTPGFDEDTYALYCVLKPKADKVCPDRINQPYRLLEGRMEDAVLETRE